MRPDMADVLTARTRRPRYFLEPKGYWKRWDRTPPEEWPRRERIRALAEPWGRDARNYLGPLRRFLHAQLGRPWDEVYAEVCTQARRRSRARKVLETRLAQVVILRVILLRDGTPCVGEDPGHGTPLHRFPRPPFYVCPLTGTLRLSRRRRRGPHRR